MEQVYCTNCKYFKIKKMKNKNYMISCKYEDKCNLTDCEDRKDLSEHYFYKEYVLETHWPLFKSHFPHRLTMKSLTSYLSLSLRFFTYKSINCFFGA